MSRSESDETDDEFESADEGDYSTDENESEENSTSEEKSKLTTQQLEIPKDEEGNKITIKEESQSSQNVASSVTVAASNSHKSCAENTEDSIENLNREDNNTASCEVNTVVSTFNNLEVIEPSEHANHNKEETQIADETANELVTPHHAETKPKEDTEPVSPVDIPPEVIPLELKGSEIPPEIANKISTRNISNSSRVRSKPTSLGAKKLGAVKLSQPPESLISTSTKFSQQTLQEEANIFRSTSISQQSTASSVKPQNDDGGWGSWFASPKLLVSSVSSIKNQILSTVENGLNIPEPEELAKQDMALYAEKPAEVKDEIPTQTNKEEKPAGFTQLFGGVSNITRFVESTGSSIFSTGLDTLELLGKKTIDVLQHNDPGLKRTKAVLANPLENSQNRTNLSEILREAKEVAEFTESEKAQATACRKQSVPTLTSYFEQHNGLVHLEALEMLSQQCQNRINPQLRRLTSQRKVLIDEIASICFLNEDSDDHDSSDSDMIDLQTLEQTLTSLFDAVGLEMSLKKFMNAFREGIADPENINSSSEFYRRALESLASVTSLSLELYHKGAERVLMAEKLSNPAVGARLEAETFQSITSLLMSEISKLGTHHASHIIRTKTSDQTNYSTDIYYEASNCRSYLQNALKLMIPVLQSRLF